MIPVTNFTKAVSKNLFTQIDYQIIKKMDKKTLPDLLITTLTANSTSIHIEQSSKDFINNKLRRRSVAI